MMSKKDFLRWVCFVVFSMVCLTSCVYDKEFAYLNDQIIGLNQRVTKIQEAMDAKLGTDLDSKLESIRTNQAQMRIEIDQVKADVKGLSGRVEDNEHVIKRAVERDLSEQDAMQAALVELSKKVTEFEVIAKRQSEYLGLEPLTAREGQGEAKAEIEQKEASVKEPLVEVPKSRELDLYDTSLASFRERKFEKAMEGFKGFLKKYPKSDRADNAQFWVGECYMALQHYEQAILAYQEVIKKYPKGNKVPNALLRQAVAFLEIKDRTSSRLLLKKIIKKYPKSNEAKIAREKLRTLR